MKIGGLDIGTTGCKFTVFDEGGRYLDKAYRTYPLKRGTAESEVNAEDIWNSVCEVMKEISSRYTDIAGFGITSFGETFVMTDEAGIPLHASMLYTDPRGEEECEALTAALGGGEKVCAVSGVKPHSMYSLPKIMWMKKHRRDLYDRAAYIFLMEDFIIFRLTGERAIDYSLASRTMGFDIRSLCWSREIFDAAGVDVNKMSAPVRTGTAVGTIRGEIASDLGFSDKTQVISIGHDQVACAVGGGALDSSIAVDGAGTVECINPIYDSLPDIPAMYRGNFAIVPYAVPGKYIAYAFSYTGGALIQWCVETLAKKEREAALSEGISVNELLEGHVSGKERESENLLNTAPTGLLVLPHFAGAATPYMDTGSRGVIAGLTLGTSVEDIYRACMEGVVYEMRLNMDYLKDTGIRFQTMHATGGGARSKVWTQMKADVLNIPFVSLKTTDAGTVGSAMLTCVAMGICRDLSEAVRQMVVKTDSCLPRKEMHEQYMEIYMRYKKLYEAVRPLM